MQLSLQSRAKKRMDGVCMQQQSLQTQRLSGFEVWNASISYEELQRIRQRSRYRYQQTQEIVTIQRFWLLLTGIVSLLSIQIIYPLGYRLKLLSGTGTFSPPLAPVSPGAIFASYMLWGPISCYMILFWHLLLHRQTARIGAWRGAFAGFLAAIFGPICALVIHLLFSSIYVDVYYLPMFLFIYDCLLMLISMPLLVVVGQSWEGLSTN